MPAAWLCHALAHPSVLPSPCIPHLNATCAPPVRRTYPSRQALGKTQLHRVCHNLCANAATREALLRLLLAILRGPLSAEELGQTAGDDAMLPDPAPPPAEGPAIDLGAPPSCRRRGLPAHPQPAVCLSELRAT